MTGQFQLKGCIDKVNFGYNAKMDGYTNSRKLCEIVERI